MRKHKGGRFVSPPVDRPKMVEIRVLVPAEDFTLLETDYKGHPNCYDWAGVMPDKELYGDACDILKCRKCGQFWVPWLAAAHDDPPSNTYYFCPRGCPVEG